MRLCSIASGSNGNCIYIGSEATHLLIDVRISKKRVESGLNGLGISLGDIDGILITHEHADHINGLSVITRKHDIPVYATPGTIEAVRSLSKFGDMDVSLFHMVYPDKKMTIKDLTIGPMRISHDAADPVAYRIAYGNRKVGICTDLGVYDDYTVECLKGMDAVLLEANHDVNMLRVGRYPYYLKQRILGERGHLSNENSGRLLSRILHDRLQAIVLGHLSQENNLPELAYEAVRMEIMLGNNPYHAHDFCIQVAKREEVSTVVHIEAAR
jgi:phosphoribosyl 1,2-cyclic phosphodiesterase